MENYTALSILGEGNFAVVWHWQAVNNTTGEMVAVKVMKKALSNNKQSMEVRSIQRMDHPNIVKLKEIIFEGPAKLFMAFEYMQSNLLQVFENRKGNPLSEPEICHYCCQLLQALVHMQSRGYFHRDLKPENILVTQGQIKIADFGSAREMFNGRHFTEYVTTRWYCAPEVILKASFYNQKVDMWALGAIMAEMFMLKPLFPGTSEADQICKTCSVIGTPNAESWAEGLQLADKLDIQFPSCDPVLLSSLIPSASEDALSLIKWLTSWNPSKRPTAEEALSHPFFTRPIVPPRLKPLGPIAHPSSSVKTRPGQRKWVPQQSAASTKTKTVQYSSMRTIAV